MHPHHPHTEKARATDLDVLTIRILIGGTDLPGGPPPVEVPSPSPPHPPGDAPGRGPETPEPGIPAEPDPVPPVPHPDDPGIIIDLSPHAAPRAATTFCAVCWGVGHIRRPAANGEGLIPVACGYCAGTGMV